MPATPEELAYAAAHLDPDASAEPVRHLSLRRILATIVAVGAAVAGSILLWPAGQGTAAAAPWSMFMPYVDATATPIYPFENAAQPGSANVVLGFIVSDPGNACQPSWGGSYTPAAAADRLDLDRRIARLHQNGGQASISFGGAANSELAIGCDDPQQLLAAYRSVVERYNVVTIDFDVEGAAASTPLVSARRAAAIATLEQIETKARRTLSVWLTLPMTPTGLTSSSQAVLQSMLSNHVSLAGVNGLTMDYGNTLPAGERLITADESALTHLAGQVASAYTSAGQQLSVHDAWQHIGATPMIGQNDVASERFDTADARRLLGFAQRHNLRRLSMWSLNRDQGCGPNYANVSVVSDDCSGVAQDIGEFSGIFSHFKTGIVPAPLITTPTTPAPSATSIVDNPATSPYPIWNPEQAYPAGTKTVWHRNVYQAKWWTQGFQPDQPVAGAFDTPWTLLGPVLPGEHPQPTPTLASGTYPAWSATKVYKAGAKVLYAGVGYEAKWFTEGDQPGIQVSDPGQTPWQVIASHSGS